MVDLCVQRSSDPVANGNLYGFSRGFSVATAPPREAAERIKRIAGKAAGVFRHADSTPPLSVPASPALRKQLRREAANHGMSLTEWTVEKLEANPLHSSTAPSAHLPVTERWRTRC